MKILCLYNNRCAVPLFQWLREKGHETFLCSTQLTKTFTQELTFDLVVSYTYRYFIPEELLQAFHFNVVNLHNSFLPWNRGADPNLWSIVDDCPRGVTLHYMSSGLDKGDIIVQRLVPLSSKDTLKTSYDALDKAAQEQFQDAFRWYQDWPQMRKAAIGKGSYHSIKDGEFLHQIIDSYDMPAKEFRKLVKRQMAGYL